tara:strand:+ start:964 stop:1911 length:948 start_codon:yes stop_codon:yes gene_type:complete
MDKPQTIIENRLIVLNSKDAILLNGNQKSNVLFNFKDVMLKSNDIFTVTMSLLDAEIPASYYNVNVNNATTSLTRNSVTYSIVVSSGNYNVLQYIDEFKSLYNTATGGTLEMTFDSITGKISMKDTAHNITINENLSTSYKLLGALEGTSPTFSNSATPSDSFDVPCNFLGVTRIKILSESLVSQNIDSHNLTTTTLIDTIGGTAGDFGLNIFNSLGRESLLLAKRIQNIDIQLRDQDNKFIDFNSIDWNISILLKIHRITSGETGDGIINNDKLQKLISAEDLIETTKKERDEELARIDKLNDNDFLEELKTKT